MTVSELIDKLRQLPQDAQVVIEDADTGWALALDAVDIGHGAWAALVVLESNYDHRIDVGYRMEV